LEREDHTLKVDPAFRLELRVVIVPVENSDEQHVMVAVQQAVSGIGTVTDASVKPYSKPIRSVMLRVEADCVGNHQGIVQQVVEVLGGTGWTLTGSGEEFEAIWSPQEGAIPPVSVLATWVHVQSIPMRVLPASRRTPTA
jgi:hypothetical protein